jgi:hypothetical protein
MPVANVPTTRVFSAVEVRVDAHRSACASRRGGRTRRADAGSAPRRCGEPASNSLCAPVEGRGALRDSRDRLLPSTTVDGSSALWSSIRFVSGRIGGFPFAFLPLEGLKRHDPHRGGFARRSKSAAMPISSSWRIDCDRKASAAALQPSPAIRDASVAGPTGVGWDPQWAVVPIPAVPPRRHASWNAQRPGGTGSHRARPLHDR